MMSAHSDEEHGKVVQAKRILLHSSAAVKMPCKVDVDKGFSARVEEKGREVKKLLEQESA